MNIETYVWRNLGLILGCALILSLIFGLFSPRWHKLYRFLNRNSIYLLWLGLISSFVIWFYAALARPFALKTSLVDLGVYSNSLFNTLNGGFLQTNIAGGFLFNWHFSPAFILLVPLFAIFPGNEILFAIQSLTVASGGLAIWLVSRHWIANGSGRLLFALIWLISVPVRGAVLFDFHETAIVAVLLLWVAYAVMERKAIWIWILALLLVGWREDAAIYLGLLSIVFIFGFGRRREGLWLIGLSIIYYLLLQLFMWDAVAPHHVEFFRIRFPHLFAGNNGLITSLIGNPLRLFQPFNSWDKLWGTLMFYLPLCFLPFCNKGWFVGVIGVFYILSINYFDYYFFNTHYPIIVFAMLLLLAMPGWSFIRRKSPRLMRFLAPLMGLLSLGLACAMPEGEIFELLHPAAYVSHPDAALLEKATGLDSSAISVSADRKLGSLFYRQINLNRFPSNYLNERIIVTNTAMHNPRFLIAIRDLGYGMEQENDSFWFLALGGKGDAGAQYLERMKWMEAEGCSTPSFTMREDQAATKGSAVFLAGCWGERFSYSPEYCLPPGEYSLKLRLRLKKLSSKPNRNYFEIEIRYKDANNNRSTLQYEKVNCDDWNNENVYHEVHIPFSVKKPGRVDGQIEFSKIGDVWWDGIGLEGIAFDFDDLYKQCIPLSLPGAQISLESRESQGMGDDPLNVRPADSETLIGRLNIPGNLPKGIYTLFYQVRAEPGHGEMQWGKVKVINANHPNDVNEERMLYSSFGSEWQPGINLESIRIDITGGDILEFYTQPGFDKNMELVHLWLSALPDD